MWLYYCLASIKKFCHGFRNVVIVSDDDGFMLDKSQLDPKWKVYYVPLPAVQPVWKDELCSRSFGYFMQQLVKMSWPDYTDADAVFSIDSDCMFTMDTRPEYFMTRGKFHWFYCDWADSGICNKWREPTDRVLAFSTTKEAMREPCFMLTRKATLAVQEHICKTHNAPSLYEYFCKSRSLFLSEFNCIGSFIYRFDDDYTKITSYDRNEYHNRTMHISWSLGGLSRNERDKRDRILQ